MVDQEKDDFSSHEIDWNISEKNKDQNKNTNENIKNIAEKIPQIDSDLHDLQDNIIDKVTEKWELWVEDIIHDTQEKLATIQESIHILHSLEQQYDSVENTNTKPHKRVLQENANQQAKEIHTNTFIYPSAETITQNKLQAAERVTQTQQNLSNPNYIKNPNWFMKNVILPITENISKNT